MSFAAEWTGRVAPKALLSRPKVEGAKSHDGNVGHDSEVVTFAVVREMMKIQESSYGQVDV